MRNKKRRRRARAALIFIEVLGLMLVTGFAAIFFYLWSQGDIKLVLPEMETEVTEAEILPEVETIVEPVASEADSEVEETEEADNSRYGALLADEEACKANRIYAKEAASADQVTLLFAGDVGLAEGYANLGQLLNRGGDISQGFDVDTLNLMRSADIFMINNEFTYTNRGTPTPDKTYTFRCDPKHVHYVTDMGADIVSLANNHTYDYGEISLTDTLDTLESADIPYVGAGRNLEEAIKPVYFIVNDIKIAYISATQIERVSNPDTRGATETSPGTFRCLDYKKVLEVVKEAKSNSDYVVTYIHWGTELEVNPDWAQLELAPKLAEAGADLIIGDHPHILQKIDYIGQTPVIYSLGNYWFNSKTQDTGLFELVLNTDASVKSVRFIPAIQSSCRTNLAKDSEKTRIINYMQSISTGIQLDEEGYLIR